MYVDVLADGCFQVFHAAQHNPSYPFISEFGEPSLGQVDPGTVGGEVNMEPWTFGEPFPDEGGFVSAVESGGRLILD